MKAPVSWLDSKACQTKEIIWKCTLNLKRKSSSLHCRFRKKFSILLLFVIFFTTKSNCWFLLNVKNSDKKWVNWKKELQAAILKKKVFSNEKLHGYTEMLNKKGLPVLLVKAVFTTRFPTNWKKKKIYFREEYDTIEYTSRYSYICHQIALGMLKAS